MCAHFWDAVAVGDVVPAAAINAGVSLEPAVVIGGGGGEEGVVVVPGSLPWFFPLLQVQ